MEERVHIPPSAYGFRSIKPKTRNERKGLKDKSALEKNRLNERVGWQARINQKNAPEHTSLLTSCTNGAAGYLSNADRFHTDVAGEEFSQRQRANQRKVEVTEFRRQQAYKRDEDRWQAEEEKKKIEAEKWNKLREDGGKAKKNTSNVAYDIMTLQYNQDTDGEQQKYHDDMVRYRAAVRSNELVRKADTRVSYNIISGNDRPSLNDPPPLEPPESMKKPMSNKVDRRMSNTPACLSGR